MKQLKRLWGLLLALVMVMALAAPTFAADADPVDPGMTNGEDTNGQHVGPSSGNSTLPGSITVEDAAKGVEYSIYRIFDLESYNRDNNAYLYKVNKDWTEFFAKSTNGGADGAGLEYVTIDEDGYVSWKGDSNTERVQAFAKLALDYAKGKPIVATDTKTGNDEDLVFVNLVLGYYLVDSSMGALCNLNTTDPGVTIKEKNEVPTNDKEVEEDSSTTFGDKNDADIGQTVNFKSTITAQAGAANYVFHDKMSAGLTFDATSVKVTLNGADVAADGNYTLTDYTAEGATPATDGCTFEIEFTKDFCDALKADDKIVISYSAVLNEGAEIAGDGNTNESKLTYGNSGETVFDKTTTYTWEMDIEKVDGDGKNLADATFTLSKNEDGSNAIEFVKTADNTYRVATQAEKDDATVTKYTEITTDSTGKFTLEGLDEDIYYLTETKEPDGYNKLDEPIIIWVKGLHGTMTANEGEDIIVEEVVTMTKDEDGDLVEDKAANPVRVLNNSGTRLPSTGGIGTTIFYVVGGVLVLGAVVLLITKRRASADDE